MLKALKIRCMTSRFDPVGLLFHELHPLRTPSEILGVSPELLALQGLTTSTHIAAENSLSQFPQVQPKDALYSAGFSGITLKTAERIIDAGVTLDEFVEAENGFTVDAFEKLCSVHGMSIRAARKIDTAVMLDAPGRDLLKKLLAMDLVRLEGGPLFGVTILAAGIPSGYTREGLMRRVREAGGGWSGRFNKSTTHVLTDGIPGNNKKLVEAEERGLPIITAETFEEMIKELEKEVEE
jgi:NAD-dependent DNA ligase